MIRHSFAEREVGSWLPTETAQTRSRSWQLNPEKAKCPIPPRAPAGRGNMSTLCALKHLAVARYRRHALSDAWQWQDFAAMRSQAAIRGNFFAPCIPEGAPDGKSAPPWQDSRAMHPKRAGFGKICAPCIRKALQIAFREYAARISCREGAPFAALTPRITHGAHILPSGVDEQREPPAPTATPSWRGSLRNAPPDTAPNRPSARNLGSAERRQTTRNRYAEAQLESQRHGLAELC